MNQELNWNRICNELFNEMMSWHYTKKKKKKKGNEPEKILKKKNKKVHIKIMFSLRIIRHWIFLWISFCIFSGSFRIFMNRNIEKNGMNWLT